MLRRAVLVALAMVLGISATACKSRGSATSSPNTAQHDPLSHQRLLVIVGGKTGYIDETGKLIVNPQYEEGNRFSEGLARVCVGECDFDHRAGYRLTKDFVREKLDRNFKYGFIDESGKLVINPMFEDAHDFREGMAAVCVGRGCYDFGGREKDEHKWGYVDKKGALVIPPQFDLVNQFHEGLAAVSVGGKWGFIDKTGKFAINPQFDFAMDFENGIATVGLRDSEQSLVHARTGYIDKSGKYVWQPSN